MKFKPIRFIPDDTKFPIMRLSRFGFFLSGILCAAAILLFVFVGLNVGVDFKGGTVITIRTDVPTFRALWFEPGRKYSLMTFMFAMSDTSQTVSLVVFEY